MNQTLSELGPSSTAVLAQRRAGVLLHPSSLPGPGSSGCLDSQINKFIDFMCNSGLGVWQTLPLGPTHEDNSPYNCLSVFALNSSLLSVDWMQAQGFFFSMNINYHSQSLEECRHQAVYESFRNFAMYADSETKSSFDEFVSKNASWLENFVLYCALRQEHHGLAWLDWKPELRDAEPNAIRETKSRLAEVMDLFRYEQFLLDRNWQWVRSCAQQHNIQLFGDLPMFVALDSAEVWGQRHLFTVDEHGRPTFVAGVPPDYFSETGQFWGNPLYNWDSMRESGYQWWSNRVKRQLEMFDVVRIDHFRGFESSWAIPAGAETAMEGSWQKVPGDELFRVLRQEIPNLPLVAEDLGIITPEVDALRHSHHLPGMKVLQFGFDGNVDNPHLPENYETNYVVYTGTHDNDTTLAWYSKLNEHERSVVKGLLAVDYVDMPWTLIETALQSKAQWAIIPLQDLLALDGQHRMNTPGTTADNWGWRFKWDWFDSHLAERLKQLVSASARA